MGRTGVINQQAFNQASKVTMGGESWRCEKRSSHVPARKLAPKLRAEVRLPPVRFTRVSLYLVGTEVLGQR